MGGAGLVTVFSGIPAPSGRLFFASFLFGEAKEREPPPCGKRQIKTSAQRIPQTKQGWPQTSDGLRPTFVVAVWRMQDFASLYDRLIASN